MPKSLFSNPKSLCNTIWFSPDNLIQNLTQLNLRFAGKRVNSLFSFSSTISRNRSVLMNYFHPASIKVAHSANTKAASLNRARERFL